MTSEAKAPSSSSDGEGSDDEVLLNTAVLAVQAAAEVPVGDIQSASGSEAFAASHGAVETAENSVAAEAETAQAVRAAVLEAPTEELSLDSEPSLVRQDRQDAGYESARCADGDVSRPLLHAPSGVQQAWPTWWDRHFMVQYGHSVTVLGLKLRALGLRDADVGSLCLALDSFLIRAVDPALPIALELDASDNKLSDRGGTCLVAWIRDLVARHYAGVRVRILKLYKNFIGDDACEALAALILELPEPVEEIHLSHNEIQQRGFTVLLAALALHPGQIYPRQTRADACPCWLRVEHNEVADTEELLKALGAQPVALRVCLAKRSEKGPSCTSFQCCVLSQSWEAVAHAHLYCVHAQSMPSTAVREKPQKLVRQVAAAITDGKLRCAGTTSKQRRIKAEIDSAPSEVIDRRTVVLRVDKDVGAGIDLGAGSYGFVVQGVEPSPGQDLKPTDVITEIDGVPLWGIVDEDDLNALFGSRFGDGARLLVASEAELERRSLWQPLGLGGEELAARCESILVSLREDLEIMGSRCGAKAELHVDDAAVSLRGPPRSQRWAVDELLRLIGFYFPECAGAPALPQSYWFGGPDELCQPSEDTGQPSASAANKDHTDEGYGACRKQGDLPDIRSWETALHRQWSEDDNLFDEDLPCEPLEAPDEGPDTFDGEVLAPDFEMSLPLRVLILVGLPGSGKSTLASRLWDQGWRIVNQDSLGDRKACVAAAKKALDAGKRVVIDRCNVSRIQRRVWLGIADELKVVAGCMWLDVDQEECGNRVLRRFGHETLPAESSSLDVIAAFRDRIEAPVEAEGFVLWRARCQDELESTLEEILELADRSETDFAEVAASSHVDHASKWSVIDSADWTDASHGAGEFKYREVRGRGVRGKYLRAVRRQVEYYFCDANLRQDWFFQEKIAEEPESGWLELRWILSCPRIKNVHQANDADVLEALGCSSLIVKQVAGVHWIRRGRPPPPLEEPRPAKGREPDWYKSLHGEMNVDGKPTENDAQSEEPSKRNSFAELGDTSNQASGGDPENPCCVACGRERPKSEYSKAQLTKHRKAPTCKDCVAAADAK